MCQVETHWVSCTEGKIQEWNGKITFEDRKTERKKNLRLTKLSKYLRYGCENTHISAVSVSHRAGVYKSIPASHMNVWQKTAETWHRHMRRCGLSCNGAERFLYMRAFKGQGSRNCLENYISSHHFNLEKEKKSEND